MTPPVQDISGGGPEERTPTAGGQEALSTSVSVHVRSLFAAAEKSAAAIRAEAEQRAALTLAEAEARASRVLEEARGDADELAVARRRQLTELSDAVVRAAESVLTDLEHAAQARSALDGLVRSLRETAERIAPPGAGAPHRAASGVGVPVAAAPPEAGTPPAETPVEADRRAVGGPGEGAGNGGASRDAGRGLTGARLVAFQMARAGSTRGEVAAHLRRAFAIRDAHEVLNDVFPAEDSTRHG